MRLDTHGWEQACLAAEVWISPARSAATFVRRLVFRSSYSREARLPGTVILHCYCGITTHGPISGKLARAVAPLAMTLPRGDPERGTSFTLRPGSRSDRRLRPFRKGFLLILLSLLIVAAGP